MSGRRRSAKSNPESNQTSTSNREPVPVIVIEDRDDDDNPPFRLFALLIFFGTLLGTLIGAVADFSETISNIGEIGDFLNPPPSVCVAGSDTILGLDLGMAQAWEDQFEQAYEAVEERRINIDINPTGSSAGVRLAVQGGCVDVLAMSERMDDEQYTALTNAGIEVECAAEIGYDVIAFVTDINNRMGSLQMRLLKSILRGEYENWDDLPGGNRDRPIVLLARAITRSGTTKHVMTTIADYHEDEFPPEANYVTCEDNESCLNQTLATPGSLYWVSTSWMRTKPPQYLRVLPILQGDERAINPLKDEDFALEEYPSELARPLYMYVLRRPNQDPALVDTARDFLDYVRSLNGQEILSERKFITYFDGDADIPIELPPGFDLNPNGVRQVCNGG